MKWLALAVITLCCACPSRARSVGETPAAAEADGSIDASLPLCSATYCDDQGHCRGASPPNCRKN